MFSNCTNEFGTCNDHLCVLEWEIQRDMGAFFDALGVWH
jgi:hypothetical protein